MIDEVIGYSKEDLEREPQRRNPAQYNIDRLHFMLEAMRNGDPILEQRLSEMRYLVYQIEGVVWTYEAEKQEREKKSLLEKILGK